MSYWGSGEIECDYAFDSIGVVISLIKKRMFEGANVVSEKGYPEQSMLASVECLRLIATKYPQCVRVSFGGPELKNVEKAFAKWYESVSTKIPAKHRKEVYDNAQRIFERYRVEILGVTD